MKYAPFRHQGLAYDWLMTHDHAGLFLGMGLGKTVVTLTALTTHLWDDFSVHKALVIAPKNVADTVWAEECRKWDHLNDLRCAKILGTAAQRRKALTTDADLYIINRENLVWLITELKGKLPFECVIIDELSSFKSAKAQRWKALKKLIQSVPYVWGLTGTPAPNSYLDLWPEVYLLDGGERLGKFIGQYRDRYFTAGAHKGHIVYEYRLRMGAKDAINRKLRDLCLSMETEDWLDLPPVIHNTVTVRMDAKARKTYDTLMRDRVLPLLWEGRKTRLLDPRKPQELAEMTNAIQGDTAAVLAGKLLQMANGAVYDDKRNPVHLHDAKLDALEEIIDTNPGQPVLVFYNYEHDKQRILERFPQATLFVTNEKEKWDRGEIPLLLVHPASAGHGLNLQLGGHLCVWFGLTWSRELYDQANARLNRPGQKESVIIHHIVCEDTVDERVMAVLAKKGQGQKELLDALRQYVKEEASEPTVKA